MNEPTLPTTGEVSQIRATCSNMLATLLLALALLIAREASAQDAAAPSASAAQPQPPARPLLYFFEHAALREAAFRYDQDIQRLIANPRQAGEPVTRLFAKAALHAAGVPTFRSETMLEDMTGFMRQIGFETLRKGGYTIHLMRMPPGPGNPNAPRVHGSLCQTFTCRPSRCCFKPGCARSISSMTKRSRVSGSMSPTRSPVGRKRFYCA